ncbi:dITP/XTP pyrophosphatase [Azospirillaceae bacterium]
MCAARTFCGDTLIIASHNQGKVREFAELLRPYAAQVQSASELGLIEPEETGNNFIANAEIKAKAAAKAGYIALADDSGLVVPALGGQPGIYSARWAGPERDFQKAMGLIWSKLGENPRDRSAFFVCALALAWPDGHCESVEGRVYGSLVWPARGERGFGYDPIFVPTGHTQTFAEMLPATKHALSHRADALQQLVERCFV